MGVKHVNEDELGPFFSLAHLCHDKKSDMSNAICLPRACMWRVCSEPFATKVFVALHRVSVVNVVSSVS